MAELAYPLSRGARAIGFDGFGCRTTLFERAWVVLVWLFCSALPPAVHILCCVIWSPCKLMDHTHYMWLVQILPCKPFVLISSHASLWQNCWRVGTGLGWQKNQYVRYAFTLVTASMNENTCISQQFVAIVCSIKVEDDASCCGCQRRVGTCNASCTGTGIKTSKPSHPPLQFTSASALHNSHLQVVALMLPSSSLHSWAPLAPTRSTLHRQASRKLPTNHQPPIPRCWTACWLPHQEQTPASTSVFLSWRRQICQPFFNSMRDFKTEKPESRTTYCPVEK